MSISSSNVGLRLRAGHVAHAVARGVDAVYGLPGAALLGALALGVYWLQELAWPLRDGRDVATYLRYYADVGYDHPVFPATMTSIQPLASLTMGFLLDHVGAPGTEIVLSLLFALSVVAWAVLASIFGKWVAVGVSIVLLLYPPYASLFHEVASDQVYAFLVALWSLAAAFALRRPTALRLALVGLALVFPVMTRVAGESFGLIALTPLLLPLAWRRRVLYTGVFVASCVAALALATLNNGIRYGDFTISRLSNAGTVMGMFSYDHLVSPGNGPASAKLARAVQEDLLNRQPYRAYGVTLHSFFAESSDRYFSDLIALSDRRWGWDARYAILRDVAIEAVRTHPQTYARNVARKLVNQFSVPYYVDATVKQQLAAAKPAAAKTIVIHGRRLPAPTEGQAIPAANLDWQLTTPDQSIWMDWSSITHPQIRFARPGMKRQFDDVTAHVSGLLSKLSTKNGSPRAAHVLSEIEHRFPALWLWLFAGIVGVAVRRPRHWQVMVGLVVGVGFAQVLVASLSQPMFLAYRIPFDPIFLLFGLVGLVGAAPPAARPQAD